MILVDSNFILVRPVVLLLLHRLFSPFHCTESALFSYEYHCYKTDRLEDSKRGTVILWMIFHGAIATGLPSRSVGSRESHRITWRT
jgi:hypothetical protein